MRYIAMLAVGICVLITQSSNAGNGTEGSLSTWCESDAGIEIPSAYILVCPQGDGESLAEVGATITVQVSLECVTISGLPPEDIWVFGCDSGMTLCAPARRAIDADRPSDENGFTTVSGTIRAGGSSTGLFLAVRGWVATGDCPCQELICLPITVVSPDIDGNLIVDLVDLGVFAGTYPPQPYASSSDFNGDGVINLLDVSLFAKHWQHSC